MSRGTRLVDGIETGPSKTNSSMYVLLACNPVTGTTCCHSTFGACRSTVASAASELLVEMPDARTVAGPRVGPLAVIRPSWRSPWGRPHLAPNAFEAP